MRWLLPIVLIAVGIGGFLLITQPIYGEIQLLQEEADAYGEALDNSAMLQQERDRLTTKYNSFNPEDVQKLEKMLPNSVDNIQLILEIQEEASKRGIIVKNVEFEPEQFAEQQAEAAATAGAVPGATGTQNTPSDIRPVNNNARRTVTAAADENKDFEAFELEFSVEGSYKDFVSFMQLMERSLRLVDINSISFTPGTSEKDKIYTDDYRYLFRINTYRLRD